MAARVAMIVWLAVATGGAAGAALRYAADRAARARFGGHSPVGTTAVNLAGSLVLGVVAGLTRDRGLGEAATALLATGLCGGLTTFSTFANDTVVLAGRRQHGAAFATVVVNVVGAVLAAAAGLAAAS